MAIKISNNTVIDDSRKFIPITIEAGGTVGSAGSVLASTGSGLEWVTAATGSGESYWVQTDVGIHTLSNVGIGTTNPTSKLTVDGSINVTGIITATEGFISVGNTTPIQISLVGNQLTFTAAGIGSTTFTLS